MGMETLDCLQPPGLAFFAVAFGPDHGFPIRLENQPRTGICQLHAVACRLPDIEKEGALDCMFMGPGFDVNTVLEEDVGSAQNIFAGIRRIGEVMKTSLAAPMLFGTGQIIGLVVDREPAAAKTTIVQPDHFGDP